MATLGPHAGKVAASYITRQGINVDGGCECK